MALRGTAGQANTSTSSTCTVAVGAIGIQLGDIVLLLFGSGGGGSETLTFPSGFLSISGLTNHGNASGSTDTVGIAYKVATASEPSSYACTSSATDYLSVQCRVYSGRNTTSPFTATEQTNGTNSTLPVTYSIAGLTAAANDDVVLMIGGSQVSTSGTLTYAPPSGFANGLISAAQTTDFSPILAGSDYVGNAGGATGTLGGTLSVTPSDYAYNYTGYLMSLAAAGGGGPLTVQDDAQWFQFIQNPNIRQLPERARRPRWRASRSGLYVPEHLKAA